jgi:hypothetical protein
MVAQPELVAMPIVMKDIALVAKSFIGRTVDA